MFQRLKGAFDSIAEEQARQRAPVRNVSSGQPSQRLRSGESSTTRKTPRSSGGPDSRSVLGSRPDPDPSNFEPDSLIDEEVTPSTPLSSKQGDATPSENIENTTSSTPEQNEIPGDDASSSTSTLPVAPAGKEPQRELSATAPDSQNTLQSADVQLRLRRLTKLETKYQELLRAYRRAHSRNSSIEPFEARLRELTPLTSIADPDAMSEFIEQLNVKGDMAIAELKRISAEKEGLTNKLKEAEKRERDASKEVEDLKQRLKETDAVASASSQADSNTKEPLETTAIGGTSRQGPSTSNKSDVTVAEASEDMFSIDEELPRLQRELEHRSLRLREMEEANESLRTSMSASQESMNRLTQDLEKARRENELALERKQSHISELDVYKNKLQTLESEMEAYRSKDLPTRSSTQTNPQELLQEDAQADTDAISRTRSKDSVSTFPTLESNGGTVDSDTKLRELQKLLEEREDSLKSTRLKLTGETELKEEIETLKDELISLGQENIENKKHAKTLEEEKRSLEVRLKGVVTESLDTTKLATIDPTANEQQESTEGSDPDAPNQGPANNRIPQLMSELNALTKKCETTEKELSAAQQLAASRYKDHSQVKDILQKAQSELNSTRTELSEVRAARDELLSSARKLQLLEAKDETLRSSMNSLKQELASKNTEIRKLNERNEQESTQRVVLEETSRKYQKDLQRQTNEKQEALNAKQTLVRDLSQSNKEAEQLRSKVKNLEQQVKSLNGDIEHLRDDISLKSAQHASAESLMGSVRDQASEIAIQMKEAKERCESLEDELTDAHRLLSERGRESETMRRLIAEVEARSDSRIKEMRERMSLALQERDQAEAEAAAAGRRRTRETEELRVRIRDTEQELKIAVDARKKINATDENLRTRYEENSLKLEHYSQELIDLRQAMSELQDLVESNEKQVQTLENDKKDLKRNFEDTHQRMGKLQKANKLLAEELRGLKGDRTKPIRSSQQSSRSSMESQRPARLTSPLSAVSDSPQPPGQHVVDVDIVYLKNVLLQFLEQKDKSHQMQLVPVLSMLLRLDKKDEQRWMSMVNSR